MLGRVQVVPSQVCEERSQDPTRHTAVCTEDSLELKKQQLFPTVVPQSAAFGRGGVDVDGPLTGPLGGGTTDSTGSRLHARGGTGGTIATPKEASAGATKVEAASSSASTCNM